MTVHSLSLSPPQYVFPRERKGQNMMFWTVVFLRFVMTPMTLMHLTIVFLRFLLATDACLDVQACKADVHRCLHGISTSPPFTCTQAWLGGRFMRRVPGASGCPGKTRPQGEIISGTHHPTHLTQGTQAAHKRSTTQTRGGPTCREKTRFSCRSSLSLHSTQ